MIPKVNPSAEPSAQTEEHDVEEPRIDVEAIVQATIV